MAALFDIDPLPEGSVSDTRAVLIALNANLPTNGAAPEVRRVKTWGVELDFVFKLADGADPLLAPLVLNEKHLVVAVAPNGRLFAFDADKLEQ